MEDKNLKENKQIEEISNDIKENQLDQSKPYAIRNFNKEIKRISWPTSKKKYKYFFLIFVFIIFLIAIFALISWGATELVKWMGAN